MNNADLQWYAEGYRNGWLSPEDTAWYEEGIKGGFIDKNTGLLPKSGVWDDLVTFGENIWSGLFQPILGAGKSASLPFTEEDARNSTWWQGINAFETGIGAEGEKGTFWTETVPQALGQIGTYAAAGSSAGKIGGTPGRVLGTLVGMIIGAGHTISSIYEEAKEYGADEKTAREAANWAGGLIGSLEAVPFMKQITGNLGKQLVLRGLGEGTQEAVSTVGENLIAKNYYDANRDPLSGTAEAGGAGGIAGMAAELVFGNRKYRAKGTTTPAPLPSERTGIVGSTMNLADQFSKHIAEKSVSVLNKYSELSPSASVLRNDIEHFEQFEGVPGQVKTPDWFELKQTNMGDLYAPVENALERVRDSWGGRKMSKGVQSQLLGHIDGTKPINLNKNQQDAVAKLKIGDESSFNNLSNSEKKLANLAYTADIIKDSVAETNYRLEQAGIIKGYSESGGLPLFFNRKNIRNNLDAFSTWLVNNQYADDLAHGKRVAQGILSNGGVAYLNDPNNAKGEKTKINKPVDPNTVPKQFVETNLETALPKYTLRAANRIAHANVFGPEGKGVDERIQAIKDELAAQGKLMEPGDEKDIKRLSDAMLNRYNPVYDETLSKMNRGAAAFEAISTLGGATLSSIQEPFIMIERAGLTPFLQSLPGAVNTLARGLIRGVNRHLIDPSGSTHVARDLGVALDAANAEVLTSAFTGDYSGIQDAFFKSPFGMFLHQWTTFNRIWATNVGMKVMDGWIKDAAKGKIRDQDYRDLGLDTQDFLGMGIVLKRNNTTLEQVLTDNASPTGNKVAAEQVLNTILPSGRTIKDAVRPALARIVNESVIAPRATNRPMWMNDQRLTAISMLKSFPIVFGNTVAKRFANKLNPKNIKNMAPCDYKNLLVAGGAILGAAYAMVAVKDAAKGKRVEDRPWADNADTFKQFLDSRIGQAIQTTGILGPVSFLTDVYQYGLGTFAGPVADDAYNMMRHLTEFGENKISAAELAQLLGQRTAEGLGAFGKFSDLQQSMGDYFYNLVD
jgi:hypothetical protein